MTEYVLSLSDPADYHDSTLDVEFDEERGRVSIGISDNGVHASHYAPSAEELRRLVATLSACLRKIEEKAGQ